IDASDVDAMLEGFDGVVMTGGGDVHPSRYGAARAAETNAIDEQRDAFDLQLLRTALDRDLAVLAICRGMQTVNVALGGTLVQHVPDVTGQVHSYAGRWDQSVHRVRVAPDSRLAGVLGATELEVNSLHHQAVCDAAPALRPVAWADDGTIEAV